MVHRRLKAYEFLQEEDDDTYQFINAIIKPATTSDIAMLAMTNAENKMRKNLTLAEEVEAQLSYLPFFFPDCASDSIIDNLNLGFYILKHWNSYIRSNFKNHESLRKVIESTKCDNPHQNIRNFFDEIGETERTFFEKADVLMNSPLDVVILLHS